MQTSAVPGRKMTDSLVLMREVFLSVTRRRWKGILVQIDQSKAFDRIDRTYLWKTLRAKGIPDAFIEHLSYLYDRAKVVPMINGWPGEKVPILSGIRQGFPLSPLLYALALDPLLSKIHSEDRIEGIITQGGRRLKTVAHADDMYVLLRDEGELQVLEEVLSGYGEASGAVINVQKSKCYFLNPDTPDIISKAMDMGRQGQAAQQKVRSIKILGTHFGLDQEIWEQDWKTWASKVGAKLQKWKDWKLNIFQRVRYFNVYCIPMALGLAIVFLHPERSSRR
ncbi:hypothetical protein lerEdw1_011494 [Lerista edwardsae]|nr:hypothetical protein lerEdw1_011494 [Lerista edwardsae]